MLTEAQLKEILDVPEAERTDEQKKSLADFFAAAGRTTEPDDKGKITLEEAFNHPRFKELNDKAKAEKARADALDKQFQDAEKKRLQDENNYKELYEKAQGEISTLKPLAGSVEEMEATLQQVLEAEVASLPDQFKDVVPEGSTKSKLDWLNKNKSKFVKPEALDIGAGAKGARKADPKNDELSPAEKQAAKDLGMSEADYIANMDKPVAA
jgi:hypothetical protein